MERSLEPKAPLEWAYHLREHPEEAEKCDLGKLDDKQQWLSLLYYQPQFANQCDRAKFNIRQDEWDEALNGKMPCPDVFSPEVGVYDAL